eukprot:4480400-Pyramimonas_sp.AAC.1
MLDAAVAAVSSIVQTSMGRRPYVASMQLATPPQRTNWLRSSRSLRRHAVHARQRMTTTTL